MPRETRTEAIRPGPVEADHLEQPSCFVIMPISDVEPYPAGHFRRVYDHIIAPACKLAGFHPVLASDVKETNMIVRDILERLYSAEMVICDLSARNPNVLFELGFRQAFNKPVTLIKDIRTERIFDISGLRDIPYDESLRIDAAQSAILEISSGMKATFEAAQSGEASVNSLVQLLNVQAAIVPQATQISGDTQLLLNAIRELGDRVGELETRPKKVAESRRLIRSTGQKSPSHWYAEVRGSAKSVEVLRNTLMNASIVASVSPSFSPDGEGSTVIPLVVVPEIPDRFVTDVVRSLAAESGLEVETIFRDT